MIRIIFENRRLLTELTLDQAFARFESRKFIEAAQRKETMEKLRRGEAPVPRTKIVKAAIMNSCPDDINEDEQANLMNWLTTLYIKSDILADKIRYHDKEIAHYAEIFFHIKHQHLDHLLKYKALEQYQSIQEFIKEMNATEPLYKKHLEEKDFKDASKGTELIYEDDDWKIYIPRNKGAACQLGKGTTWCTAAPGLDHYKGYHTDENPLIVFINKKDPEDKYQFSFGNDQFMDKDNQPIRSDRYILFCRLNQLLMNVIDKLPEQIANTVREISKTCNVKGRYFGE